MAYVNMTVNGSTKRTEQLNLVGADGTTKTAILEAVLEASDGVSSGGVESGVATGDGTNTMALATSKNHVLCIPNGEISAVLGGVRGIVFFFVDKDNNMAYGCGTNAAGTSTGGIQSMAYNTSNVIVKVEGGNAVSNSAIGVFPEAKEYAWFAW